MHRFTIRHLAAATALALITVAPIAACGEDSVAPLPGQAAPTATGGSAHALPASSPPRVADPPAKAVLPKTRPKTRPTSRPTTGTPTRPVSCHGAIRYDLDLHNTVLDLVKSMCFRVGGVLRLQGIGPGLVTTAPSSLVSSSYEAGVVDLRFVRTGTVVVSIPQDEKIYPITVVVVS